VPSGDGIHDLWINATDTARNQRVVDYQFITDDIDPVISLMGIANDTILNSGSPINLIVTDSNFENLDYQWDSAEPVNDDESDVVLYAPPLEGDHWLNVNATDKAGNTASASYMFIVDSKAPEISVMAPIEGSSNPSGTRVTIEVSDLYLESVYFKWDSGTWSEWSAPYVTFSPVDKGYHALFVNATDIAGNRVQAVFIFITVDASTTSATSTTTTTTTTSVTTTETTGPTMDIPTSLVLTGIGVYIGIVLAYSVFKRRRTTAS
jgi:hypothetical protein